MIERYTREQMGNIWTLENKFATWQKIEVLACEAQAELGKCGITKKEAAWIGKHANFSVAEIDEVEKVTNHDVIAFTTVLAKYIDADVPADKPKPSRWVHYGMTSSDLGDTALCYLITQALDICIEDVARLGQICKRRSFEEKDTLCVGRTHGIHAEPMTIGMKFGMWAQALKRAHTRLLQAREQIAVGAISGAVGSYSNIDPFIEQYVCEHLGLMPDPLSTQVINRDRHAQVLSTLAICAATLEQIATEVRHLQKTDTLEAEEPFAKGQKGSSAMPHKRNPITVERICGLSRVIKANAQVGFDNVALWHERDISHSGAERIVLPDSFIAFDYMCYKMENILDNLVLYRENSLANLNKTRGLIYSSRVLLALVNTGITREDAYKIVQRNAMEVWHGLQNAQNGPEFRDLLEKDKDCNLDSDQLDNIFNPQNFLTRKDVIFKRLDELDF